MKKTMKELRLGPYKDYGKLTLGQALKRYWPGILMLFAITFFVGYVTLYLLRLKKEIAKRKKTAAAADCALQFFIPRRKAGLFTKPSKKGSPQNRYG